MDPSPVDPAAVQLRRRVAAPLARSLSAHRGHTRREYPGSRLGGRHHREAGRGRSTPGPVPVARPALEIRPWRLRRSWLWPPDGRSPAWRFGAWFASVTATWTGDVRMQPAVAVELMEASGDCASTDGRVGTLDSIVPDGAPALRSRGGVQRPKSRRGAAGTRAAARVARLRPPRPPRSPAGNPGRRPLLADASADCPGRRWEPRDSRRLGAGPDAPHPAGRAAARRYPATPTSSRDAYVAKGLPAVRADTPTCSWSPTSDRQPVRRGARADDFPADAGFGE